MFSDFTTILYWWVFLFGIGAIFFPLTCLLFRNFFDRGYALSKILGILVVSYMIWLLGSLKILPFSVETIWLVLIFAIGINFFIAKNKSLKLKPGIKKLWKVLVFEEILFLVTLSFWSFVRGYQPDIQGLEKFMDFGFVNSILRNRYFPPSDIWMSGRTINYYYFGHLATAVLTKLSGIDPAITYNLMIATIFALSFTASFCLGSNLLVVCLKKGNLRTREKVRGHTAFDGIKDIRPIFLGGLFSASLVNLGGNLHALWWFLKHKNFTSYWYPDATRFIVELFGAADNTIHEFPIYSYVVADLHGHLLDLPFVILFLSLIVVVSSYKKIPPIYYFFICLILGVMYMTNAWDFPIYLLILGLIFLTFNYLKYKFSLETFWQTGWLMLGILAGSLMIDLPFHLNFKSIAQGLKLVDFHSPLWMLLVLWGFPLFTTATFLLYLFFKRKTHRQQNIPLNVLLLVLILVSWFLIFFPEVLYIKDIYIHSYQRANTMFKLTYQSFVMFAFVGGYVISRILNDAKKIYLKMLYLIFLVPLLSFIFIYPYYAVKSYYGLKNYRGLYGLEYLKKSYPNDYDAVVWMNKNILGLSNIIEAVGESYTDFARVSANTGLPTILGWRVHEWLWRGSFDEPGLRTEDVREIYESPDLAKTKELLNKYGVEYIFLGSLERKQYVNLQEKKFTDIGEVVYSSGETKIYKLKSLD